MGRCVLDGDVEECGVNHRWGLYVWFYDKPKRNCTPPAWSEIGMHHGYGSSGSAAEPDLTWCRMPSVPKLTPRLRQKRRVGAWGGGEGEEVVAPRRLQWRKMLLTRWSRRPQRPLAWQEVSVALAPDPPEQRRKFSGLSVFFCAR